MSPSRASFFLFCAALIACSAAPSKKHREPVDPGADFGLDDVPQDPPPLGTDVNPDSGAFGAGARPSGKDASTDGGRVDASVDAGSDSGVTTKTYCTGALAAGDVVISELMIASRAGVGDDGEWVELTSTRDCWLKLQGLVVDSPRGTTSDAVAIDDGFELEPHGTFVVADSADPARNHGLPGKIYAWNATDVLKNTGDSVEVKLGATVVDTLTYPAFSNLSPGRSIAFPDDCKPADRADWQRWSLTFDSWAAGFQGTPNAANSDVACY